LGGGTNSLTFGGRNNKKKNSKGVLVKPKKQAREVGVQWVENLNQGLGPDGNLPETQFLAPLEETVAKKEQKLRDKKSQKTKMKGEGNATFWARYPQYDHPRKERGACQPIVVGLKQKTRGTKRGGKKKPEEHARGVQCGGKDGKFRF